jgi:hypothetical protein
MAYLRIRDTRRRPGAAAGRRQISAGAPIRRDRNAKPAKVPE